MKNRKVIISSESACELTKEQLEELDVKTITVRFFLDGEEQTNKGLTMSELYAEMASGKRLTTSQINEFEYMEYFEDLLKDGKEVVHIGFSSGLSGMFNCAKMSLEKLQDKYQNKVTLIDTKNGSLALGLLIHMACEMADNGASAEEIKNMVEDMKNHVSTIITANELKYLYASGRLSKLTAIVGGILNIKPVFKVAENGKFQTIAKSMSRKKSLMDLTNYLKERFDNYSDLPVFILHANCEQDAILLKNQVEKLVDVPIKIQEFGPIIGGHSGPGTIAMFFTSKCR